MPPSPRRSAGAIYLNRTERIAELRDAAQRAQQRMRSIERVVLFGSLVHGTASPRSDADLLVVLRTSEHEQRRERIPSVLAAFAPLPCPIDLFVLTRAELDIAMDERSPLAREALERGLDLLH